MCCWLVVVAPEKLMFVAVLLFGVLAIVLVSLGRALARAGFVRVVSPERVLLIGTGRALPVMLRRSGAN